jgi:hypothetical protein
MNKILSSSPNVAIATIVPIRPLPPELQFYATHKAALFPIPYGKKDPHGIVPSFKHDYSTDPAQWQKWRDENPRCNFGVLAFKSWGDGGITLDTDVSPREGQTAEEARAEAWTMRWELFKEWGLDPEKHQPHVNSARNGWHDYFALPARTDACTLRSPEIIKGRIEVKLVGYTIAVGSHYDGLDKGRAKGDYTVHNDAPPHPAPQGLIDHCTPKQGEIVHKVGQYDLEAATKLFQWIAENDAACDKEKRSDDRVIRSDDDWYKTGMACRLEFGENGLPLWAMIAVRTGGVLDREAMTRWQSFDTEPQPGGTVTLRTVFDLAGKQGWKGHIPPPVELMFDGGAEQAAIDAEKAKTAAAAALELVAPTPAGGFIQSSKQFMAARKNPEYLIKPIFQRRRLYSITAQTDTGKTNVALRLSAHVGIGRKIDDNVTCKKGTVIYFAGETPEDVADRWLALCEDMKIDRDMIDVHFIPEAMHISKIADRITQEVTDKKLQVAMVVVDTSAAYFETDNESDPIQALAHAKRMRTLTLLPGGPCVLLLCHPVKGAKNIEDMIPRGGSGLVNEVDGNMGLYRTGDVVTGQKVHKFRGQKFDPISFETETVFHPEIVDSDGIGMPTVICRPISYGEVERAEKISNKNQVAVLKALCDHPGSINADIGKALGWLYMTGMKKGKPDDSKVRAALKGLKTAKLVEEVELDGGRWTATPKGQKALNAITNAEQCNEPLTLAPANLGSAPYPTPRMTAPPPMPPGAGK